MNQSMQQIEFALFHSRESFIMTLLKWKQTMIESKKLDKSFRLKTKTH
jgi:hypothetical protein